MKRIPPPATRSITTRASTINKLRNGPLAQLGYFLALSTPLALSMALYNRQQGSLQMDSGPSPTETPQRADPTLVPQARQTELLHTNSNNLVGEEPIDVSRLPREDAILTTAPDVPPQITRDHPVILHVPLTTDTKVNKINSQYKYYCAYRTRWSDIWIDAGLHAQSPSTYHPCL